MLLVGKGFIKYLIMVEKIDIKIREELEKILSKDTLTSEEIQTLISIKSDFKFDEKMKKMIKFTS